MSSCCSTLGDHFNGDQAGNDLKNYLRKGPNPTTRKLLGMVRRAGGGRSVLDVGGGIGALSFELLRSGFEHATILDASPAYVEVARREAVRQGNAERVTALEGDFVTVGKDVPPADVVVLDRAVCCYPEYQPLLEEALRHSHRLFALSFPRDLWPIRIVVALQNVVRALGRDAFRMFVHPATAMEALAGQHGFRCVGRGGTMVWCVKIYARGDATKLF